MDKKTAQIIFVVLNIIAVPAVGYGIYDYISVSSAIAQGSNIIPFDSGTYYLFLMSLFWVLSIIQMIGLKNPQQQPPRYSNQIVIFWFVAMLIVANLIPYNLQQKFEMAGYTKCDDPREISRISRGESSVYTKKACREPG